MDYLGSSSKFPLENHHHHHHQILNSSNYNNPDSRTDFEQQQQQQEMESSSHFVEKEHMFDKVVTPSDVGKLNRLVIPKQHAEKYFPLDSSSNEKGLLLNFEDRGGKSWRFRYSYWTSSQSYVMTKGWSRFVKEKRLDAGDIVSFQRGVGNVAKDLFFIDWRRRPPHPAVETAISFHHHHQHGGGGGGGQIPHHVQLHQWSPLATPLSLHRDHVLHLHQNNRNHNNITLFHNNNPYNYHHHHSNHRPIVTTGGGGGGSYAESPVFYHRRSAPAPPQEAMPGLTGRGGGGGIGKGGAAAKTLRLFGVNMECAVSEDQSDEECDITTLTTTMSPRFRVYNGMPMSMPLPMSMSTLMQMPNSTNIPTMEFFDKGKSSMSSSLDFGT